MKKLSYKTMLQLSKYLDYLHYNLDNPYLITQTVNQFYFGIQNSVTGEYYVKPIKIKK